MDIDSLEDVPLGDTIQSIHIRGVDPSNPVLLLIQQGPALPMINETRRFERVLGLEELFTVVYWDQRGCGRSLRTRVDPSAITVARMTDDTVSLLELLRDRFGHATYVAGFSLGATIGARAAARRPDLVATLVAVGTDVDGVAAATSAYDFALRTARARDDRRAIRQLKSIGPPPHLTAKQFTTRARWVTNYGGLSTNETYSTFTRALVVSLVRSSAYSARDIVRIVRRAPETRTALLPDLSTLDLLASVPELEVPVVMVQGRRDEVSPGVAAQRYAERLQAPSKQLVWFERSAHTPHLDEPVRFRELLAKLPAAEVAPA
jgi:pimeloyl-ACP methyl ester carboxylesterase